MATIDPDTRSLLVARLRAEADRLEQGGTPLTCVAERQDDYGGVSDDSLSVDEARRRTSDWITDADPDDGAVEDIGWCYAVPIEYARIVGVSRSDWGARYAARYELRPVDDTTAPVTEASECPACGHEEACPPGGTCSACGWVDPGAMP